MQASSLQKKAVVKSAAQNLPFHLSSGFWWSLPASVLSAAVSPNSLLMKQLLRKVSIQGLINRISLQANEVFEGSKRNKRLWDGKKSSSMSITAFSSDPAVLLCK